MTNITQAVRSGNSHTIEQLAVQQAAQALLDADRKTLDKGDRVFLQAVKRHGSVSREGAARIAAIVWLLNGGRP